MVAVVVDTAAVAATVDVLTQKLFKANKWNILKSNQNCTAKHACSANWRNVTLIIW